MISTRLSARLFQYCRCSCRGGQASSVSDWKHPPTPSFSFCRSATSRYSSSVEEPPQSKKFSQYEYTSSDYSPPSQFKYLELNEPIKPASFEQGFEKNLFVDAYAYKFKCFTSFKLLRAELGEGMKTMKRGTDALRHLIKEMWAVRNVPSLTNLDKDLLMDTGRLDIVKMSLLMLPVVGYVFLAAMWGFSLLPQTFMLPRTRAKKRAQDWIIIWREEYTRLLFLQKALSGMGDVKINSDSDLVKTALNETIRVLNLLEGEKRKLSVEELVPFLQAIVELRDDQKVLDAMKFRPIQMKMVNLRLMQDGLMRYHGVGALSNYTLLRMAEERHVWHEDVLPGMPEKTMQRMKFTEAVKRHLLMRNKTARHLIYPFGGDDADKLLQLRFKMDRYLDNMAVLSDREHLPTDQERQELREGKVDPHTCLMYILSSQYLDHSHVRANEFDGEDSSDLEIEYEEVKEN